VATLSVRTLLGHAQLPLGLRCLGSFARSSHEPVQFVIHEDGTLTEEDAAILREKLPLERIVSRREADERIIPLLEKFPACAEFRRRTPMGLKLFDSPLFSEGHSYFCDSDILFIKPHRGLFNGVLNGARAVFMQDSRQSLSLYPWNVWPFENQRLVSRLNSGLMALDTRVYDLDYINYFLTRNASSRGFTKRWPVVEQTCWAALASRFKTLFWDPRQIAMALHRLLDDHRETVAIHFVSSIRGLIEGFTPYQPVEGQEVEPVTLRLKLAHPHRFLAHEICHRLGYHPV